MDTLFERDAALNADRSPFSVVGALGFASNHARCFSFCVQTELAGSVARWDRRARL